MEDGIIKLNNGWIRDTLQETGAVHKWYERKKGGVTASLVTGNFPNELQWRISSNAYDSFEVNGGKDLMLKKSDTENIRMIERLLEREKYNK